MNQFILLQVLIKQIIHRDLRHLADITQFVLKIYQVNSHPSMKIYNLCKINSENCQFILKVIPNAYTLAMSFYVIPIYVKIVLLHKYIPTFGIFLPYLNESILLNAIVIEMYNFLCELISVVTVVPYDGLVYIVLISFTMISTIITEDLKEFENVLKHGNITECEINKRLIKIIQMHEEYDK